MSKTKKQKVDKDKNKNSNELFLYLKSLILFYFFLQVQKGLDYNILNHVNQIEADRYSFSDIFRMPLAPHRYNVEGPEGMKQYFWLFHRTELSMDDFVAFVQTESTLVKTDHDFHMDFPFNRSKKDGNLVPQSEWVTFEPSKTYNRTTVRRFLYEYISKRVSWSKRDKNSRDDGTRYWYIGKAVKDYIIMSGKQEFTYEEIQEIIESQCILNFANDLIYYVMEDWVRFMDREYCLKNPGSQQCESDKAPLHTDRMMRYYLMDPSWLMVQEFLKKGTTNHFFEKLMVFDEWDNHLPIITEERAVKPSEAQVEFFQIPKERRGQLLNFTDQFESLDGTLHKKMKRSIHEYAQQDLHRNWASIQYLEVPNIARGFHFSVKLQDDRSITLGHDTYNFYNEDRQLLWLRFSQKYSETKENFSQQGIPNCIWDYISRDLTLDELYWVRCPSKDINEKALSGMSKEFMNQLGIYDEKYINGETGLIFEFMISY